MKNIYQVLHLRLLIFLFLFLLTPSSIFSAEDSINVNLHVSGCNNNYICESSIGEDVLLCPHDCSPVDTGNNDGNTGSNTGSGSSGSFIIPIISIRSTVLTESSVGIIWSSNVPVNASVRWSGGSSSGAIQEVGYTNEHVLYLPNLRPDSLYTITIEAKNLNGMIVSETLSVYTKKSETSIQTVSNFNLYPQNGGVVLTWKNPSEYFDYVRIVKSKNFFPTNPYDGNVIYEGSAQSFFDSEITDNTRYYYSIFVKNGIKFSTGVAEYFIHRSSQDPFNDTGQPISPYDPIFDDSAILDIHKSSIWDYIRFYQNGTEIIRANNTFFVENKKEILITIDQTKDIGPKSKVYITYFDSVDMKRTKQYVFEYNVQQKKFVSSFLISNMKPDTSFIIYIKNENDVKGYVGYFSTQFDPILEEKGFFEQFLSHDLLVSSGLLLLVIFTMNLWWIILFIFKKRASKN